MQKFLLFAAALVAAFIYLSGGTGPRIGLSSSGSFGAGPVMGGAAGGSIGGAAVSVAGRITP